MVSQNFKRTASAAALAFGLALGGCEMDIQMSGSDGVPLADLDMSGDAPTALAIAGPDKVIITEGDTLNITVDGDADAAAELRFDIDGDTLEIGRESGNWGGSGSTTVNVTMPVPKSLSIGGSGTVEAPSLAKEADVNIGGSGNVIIAALDVDDLDINVGGSGEVSAKGTVKKLDVTIGGNGDIKFADVQVDDADITIGGSGDVAFASDGTVEATIGGSGDIKVVGNAKCELSSFGSGTLDCGPAEVTADAAEPEAGGNTAE
ncbi:head GIN domain-containing protein [Pontixanthobacter sp. CEM42]|uniref:head GIN domain-containing protein n=1 Tax=Pontixanthobacter sp. CEM42 TaxID=2792077 RepID=UPI001FD7FC3A|nr:head GIN domain-containing protein [Pontixanthobacter sp. CEM42]